MSARIFGLQMPSGLLAIKGPKHKRHVRYMLPMLKKSKVVAHLSTIIDCSDRLIRLWRNKEEKTLNENIVGDSKHLLLDIIGFIAFDYDLQTIESAEKEKKEFTKALDMMISAHTTIVASGFLPYRVLQWWLKWNPSYQRAIETVRQIANKIIEKEADQSADTKPKNMITLLVSSLQENEQEEAKKPEEEKQGLSRAELLDEILVSFAAGFETTSTALSWAIFYLSKHPYVQDKIKQELRDNKITTDTCLTADLLDRLTYIDCVMKEVLRFAPVVDCQLRTLTQDDEINGLQLKKGDSVLTAFYNAHMDKRCWTLNPQEFLPERFLNADKNHHPCALGIFGGGHRACIGQDLARLELKTIITRLMQFVTFVDGGEEKNSGGKRQELTCVPKHVAVYIHFD
ncbi:unnamed protein product [Didymodactylos carnosus]|uniref:Cytochrome P450 n=1 Tax=Didymodactylos carnosus TaxID=1234261 RepID=A0A815S2Z0_9BILA|nr:unnamed protein product [Didymodactylos carnosus]CAF1485022.1 unnamed protein product [Didymodactylos carnosus]CAF3673578.1 unnamed protein product [Didymodactylos carnosus]CAF4349264.1 unnamed protein product [Didymodactylos carnosus]